MSKNNANATTNALYTAVVTTATFTSKADGEKKSVATVLENPSNYTEQELNQALYKVRENPVLIAKYFKVRKLNPKSAAGWNSLKASVKSRTLKNRWGIIFTTEEPKPEPTAPAPVIKDKEEETINREEIRLALLEALCNGKLTVQQVEVALNNLDNLK